VHANQARFGSAMQTAVAGIESLVGRLAGLNRPVLSLSVFRVYGSCRFAKGELETVGGVFGWGMQSVRDKVGRGF
jgi:hypothetical protein